MKIDPERILVLAPHTDDGELGCGGTISHFIGRGVRVKYVVFSACEKSVPEGYPKDILRTELHGALDVLHIPAKDIVMKDYPVRCFSEYRQNILDDMIAIGRDYKPDMVFAPSMHDVHQDHATIAAEAQRAFKKTTLLGYECPWNNYSFNNQAFISLEKKDVEHKISALQCYKTQQSRDYFSDEYIWSVALMHGVQIGTKYAEIFEINRIIFGE